MNESYRFVVDEAAGHNCAESRGCYWRRIVAVSVEGRLVLWMWTMMKQLGLSVEREVYFLDLCSCSRPRRSMPKRSTRGPRSSCPVAWLLAVSLSESLTRSFEKSLFKNSRTIYINASR